MIVDRQFPEAAGAAYPILIDGRRARRLKMSVSRMDMRSPWKPGAIPNTRTTGRCVDEPAGNSIRKLSIERRLKRPSDRRCGAAEATIASASMSGASAMPNGDDKLGHCALTPRVSRLPLWAPFLGRTSPAAPHSENPGRNCVLGLVMLQEAATELEPVGGRTPPCIPPGSPGPSSHNSSYTTQCRIHNRIQNTIGKEYESADRTNRDPPGAA